MTTPSVTLGGIKLWTNPHDIRWNFKIKTTDTKCLGGKVIQILGTELSDITIQGAFGNGERGRANDTGWKSEMRLRDQVEKWADRAVNADDAKGIIFTYAPRDWRFRVFVKSISPIHQSEDETNPKWTLTLFPIDHGSRAIVEDIKDLYIKRLMDGIGWKQTDYNGPQQDEVDELLSGRSVRQYIANTFGEAYEEGAAQAP